MERRLLLAVLLLSVAAFATNVNNARYEGSISTWHFDTDMQFTTDVTVSLLSGDMVSGNPNDLQSGDTVCSGAVIRVDPSVNARWATPDFAATAIYPTCGAGYCPAMIPYSSVTSNRNVVWLSSSDWNDHYSFGLSNDFSQSETRYNDLGGGSSFASQPVTYSNVTGQYISNREGDAGVFCNGTLQVIDGSSVEWSTSMPTTHGFNLTVTGAGSHQVGARLSNVNCFGVVVKNPLDLPANPSWFWMDYFVRGAGTSIPSTMATDTINLNVGTGTATCSFSDSSVEASGSFVQDRIMVRTTMCNNGQDPINISDVSSDNSCYDVIKAPEGATACNLLGIPSTLCPASNGFDQPLSAGACTDVYVHVVRTCTTGCPTLTYTADSSTGGSCGSSGSACGTHDVSLCGPITCEVEPPALEMGTLEVGDFGVTCYDIADNQISCVGNDWYWQGLNGDFVDRTNSNALAYFTDPPGASGQLYYNSGVALCSADVTSRAGGPWYECEFDPPSEHVEVGDSEYFNMTCYLNGTETPPDDAQYDLIDGLTGSTSDESIDGTTYNAPNSPDNGRLQGYGEHQVAPYIVGAVALADIVVVNTTGNGSNGSNGGDPDGGTDFCTIGSGALNVFPGYNGYVDIRCGPDANETCDGVIWSIDDGHTWSESDYGTGFTIDGTPGTQGSIFATVNTGDPNHPNEFCWLPYFIGIPDCWEFT